MTTLTILSFIFIGFIAGAAIGVLGTARAMGKREQTSIERLKEYQASN